MTARLQSLTRTLLHRAALACSALAVLAATSAPVLAQQPAQKLIPINIGLPVSNYWPAYIARDLKIYEEVGLARSSIPSRRGHSTTGTAA